MDPDELILRSSAQTTTSIFRRYAGAVLRTTSGLILLQQRDFKPEIVNPGMVTLFGGQLEGDETFEGGLARELMEEVEVSLSNHVSHLLGYVDKPESDGTWTLCALYLVEGIDPQSITLHEGRGLFVGTPRRAIDDDLISPVARLAVVAAAISPLPSGRPATD